MELTSTRNEEQFLAKDVLRISRIDFALAREQLKSLIPKLLHDDIEQFADFEKSMRALYSATQTLIIIEAAIDAELSRQSEDSEVGSIDLEAARDRVRSLLNRLRAAREAE